MQTHTSAKQSAHFGAIIMSNVKTATAKTATAKTATKATAKAVAKKATANIVVNNINYTALHNCAEYKAHISAFTEALNTASANTVKTINNGIANKQTATTVQTDAYTLVPSAAHYSAIANKFASVRNDINATGAVALRAFLSTQLEHIAAHNYALVVANASAFLLKRNIFTTTRNDVTVLRNTALNNIKGHLRRVQAQNNLTVVSMQQLQNAITAQQQLALKHAQVNNA